MVDFRCHEIFNGLKFISTPIPETPGTITIGEGVVEAQVQGNKLFLIVELFNLFAGMTKAERETVPMIQETVTTDGSLRNWHVET